MVQLKIKNKGLLAKRNPARKGSSNNSNNNSINKDKKTHIKDKIQEKLHLKSKPKSDTEKKNNNNKNKKRKHYEALLAGFENVDQHEAFKKEVKAARRKGISEPPGPTAPHYSLKHVGVTQEQKEEQAEQAKQEHTSS
jgi:hypothetical protein